MDFNALIKRAKNILIKPNEEWDAIVTENKTRNEVLAGYALPFIVVIALSSASGSILFSFGFFSMSYIIATTVVSILVPVTGIYISSYIINVLAPAFGSIPNLNNTFKLVIYSYTALFVVNIVTGALPFLFFIGIAGIYSLYIFWLGFAPMMKTPDNKKVGFVIVSLIVIIGVHSALSIIMGFLIASIFISNAAHILF